MSETQKYKRLLFLHKLGIAIDAPLGEIFDKLKNYFNFVKVVKIIVHDDVVNICYIGEDDSILYTLYGSNISLLIHKPLEYFDDIFIGWTNEDSIKIAMMSVIIDKEKNGFQRVFFNNPRIERYCAELKDLYYDKGKYELVELCPSGRQIQNFEL